MIDVLITITIVLVVLLALILIVVPIVMKKHFHQPEVERRWTDPKNRE